MNHFADSITDIFVHFFLSYDALALQHTGVGKHIAVHTATMLSADSDWLQICSMISLFLVVSGSLLK